MQAEKPKIAPRPSVKKPENDDILSAPEIKPIPKPRIAAKPSINQRKDDRSQNENTLKISSKPEIKHEPTAATPKDDLEVRDLSVKITNKLKISAGDLAKLRSRSNWIDYSNQNDSKMQIYDVREDEEQIKKMEEISELLIVAGYFRARIKGLHNFDKIIGGMCWAIQMCNIDLDVDIFYQDSLSIGQKISLTEKIVRVLQQMKCPHELEPHQIQGMDCIHIFPVVQWLIKRSLETRKANADTIRAFGCWQYCRLFSDARPPHSDSVLLQNDKISDHAVNPLKAKLERKFVHPSREMIYDHDLRTKTTMLEYGILGLGLHQRELSPDDKIKDSSSNSTNPDNRHNKLELSAEKKTRSESDSAVVENLLSVMSEADMEVDANIIGNILSEQSQEIRRLAKEYEKILSEDMSLEQQFRQKESKFKASIFAKKTLLSKLQEKDNISEKLENIKNKINFVDDKLKQFDDSQNDQTADERLQNSEILTMLRKQKNDFKQHCRDEQKKLENEIETLKRIKLNNLNDSPGRNKNIMTELDKLEDRHDELKKELSKINKEHIKIARKFAEIPTRTELSQYQKRFIELYNQLSTKHNETKKFYTMFNVLADKRTYLEKEFKLINSILENFQTAQNSSTMVKEEFLVKFGDIVESIVQNTNKVSEKLLNEKLRRDHLNTQYVELLEQQRMYFKAVKLFKEECARNESLIAALES